MDVLVAGGTGFVGAPLCAELADRGHDVTALARTPDADAVPPAVDTLAADVTADDLKAACEGRDAIVNLIALSPLYQPKGTTHDAVHVGGTRRLLEASEAADVDRFVQMSALGADPDGRTAYLRAKGRAENAVRDADLDWTIIRPSVIFGDGGEFVSFTRKLTTPYLTGLPGGGKTPFQPIWVEDMAEILADAATEPEHANETYEIGGPEVLTIGDVARLAHRANGRSLSIIPVPMALAKVGMGIAGAVPGVPFGPDQFRSLQEDNTVDENDVAAFGIDPADLRTLADYLDLPAVSGRGAAA
jgi:uncharacterized protein YbjT (DUF2867 family)